ncbi:hypothetical protein [Chthonobacter rhizosphaerae]|uniref:hypothetical protein n=1 Tax=Chthonobacter rhizosphaerae TaxID=2735553 RepID=UPI0015EF3B73|nr:hypothetical protein [Chthonobacter rhizosphaerae]
MKYVQRRANRFEFRFPFPDDIAGKLVPVPWPDGVAPAVNTKCGRFKTELVRSLGTNDVKAAERSVLLHIAEAHALVDLARALLARGPASSLRNDEVASAVQSFEAAILRGDETLRTVGIGLNLRRPGGSKRHDGLGMTDDDLSLYQKLIEYLDKDVRSQLARMRPGDQVGFIVNKAMHERGVVLHPDDPAWRQLEVEFLKAQRRAIDGIKQRLAGEEVPTPRVEESPSRPGVTLRQVFERWANGGGRGARKPSEGAINEARRSVDRFVELYDDLPISVITKAHGRAFRDALAQLPARLPDNFRRLPLPDLLKCDLNRYPRRSAQTVNKTLALLGGILARADKDGYFEVLASWSNPFHVGFEIALSEREPYEPFSADELRKLFASPVFVHGTRPLGGRGEAAYWLPLIALYSGARRTEIAQLRIRDLRQGENGIWFFDFTDEGHEQSLKTASSVRSVPVHRELIRLGLLPSKNFPLVSTYLQTRVS